MQHITNVIQTFRYFIEPGAIRNLEDLFEKYKKTGGDKSFEDFALGILGNTRSKFEDSLTEVMLTTKKMDRQDLLDSLNMEIDHVIHLCEKITTYDSSFLTKYFTEFKNYFNKKYNPLYVIGDKKDAIPVSKKIKWLGNINTLTTYLIQLHDGNNTLNKALIECEIQQLKDLILNNFLKSDGRDFSIETINTYLDLNKRDEKQAKKERLILSMDGNGFAEATTSVKPTKVNNVQMRWKIPKSSDSVD